MPKFIEYVRKAVSVVQPVASFAVSKPGIAVISAIAAAAGVTLSPATLGALTAVGQALGVVATAAGAS
jgi:ABC-type thiamin/hydroxymethylpyrimidine transport system permease subunit